MAGAEIIHPACTSRGMFGSSGEEGRQTGGKMMLAARVSTYAFIIEYKQQTHIIPLTTPVCFFSGVNYGDEYDVATNT